MSISKTLTAIAAMGMIGFASPAFAQSASDMSDAVKQKISDAKSNPDNTVIESKKATMSKQMDENTMGVVEGTEDIIMDKKGVTHVVDDVKATKYTKSVNDQGQTVVNARSVEGVAVRNINPIQMSNCPYGTTMQPDNTCLITGNYQGR